MTAEDTVARPVFEEQAARLAHARALLERCDRGFGAFVHGRKMGRRQR